jgi:hypothetical protein
MLSTPIRRRRFTIATYVAPLIAAWLLNSSPAPVKGYSYVWDDTATWTDANIFKDSTPIAAWLLNSSATPVYGYTYTWIDTSTWADANKWKDQQEV